MSYKKSNNIFAIIAIFLVCMFVLPFGLSVIKESLDGGTNTEATAGKDGISPHIGENGNWFVGDADTGVKAKGDNGADGVGIEDITTSLSADANGKPCVLFNYKMSNEEIKTVVVPFSFKTINGESILGSGNISVNGNATAGETDYIELAKTMVSQYEHQMSQKTIETAENEVDIILFAGQSNMCGRATLEDCTTPKDIIVNTPIEKGFSFNNGANAEPTAIVEPISANNSTGYGLIPSFINSYYETTGRRVCSAYMSQGGVMLNKFLPYTVNEEGEQVNTPTTFYTKMVSNIEDAKVKLVENGFQVGHIFLAWCQGEGDAVYYGSTNNYANVIEQGLTEDDAKTDYYVNTFGKLLSSLKADAGVEKAFIVRIGNKRSKDTLLQPIINAQSQLCKTNKDCVLVSTVLAGAKTFIEEDGTVRDLMRDDSHYVPEGYLRCGIESGVNAGIYVNSNFKTKPILLEYNNIYLEKKGLLQNIEYARKVDKYLYDPCRIDIFTANDLQNVLPDTPEVPETPETPEPSEPETNGQVILDLDFSNLTLEDMALEGLISIPSTSDTFTITYSSAGMSVIEDRSLPNGLKLITPIDATHDLEITMVATFKPFAGSGTSKAENIYKSFGILSGSDNHTSHSTECPCPFFNCRFGGIQFRAVDINLDRSSEVFALYDGMEHTYTFKLFTNTIEVYVDGTLFKTYSFSNKVTGYYEYILGHHPGYSYAATSSLKTGHTIKSFTIKDLTL